MGNEYLTKADHFDHRKINYLETYKKNINFSFMQSICLIAAYLAGANSEKHDGKIFTKLGSRTRRQPKAAETKQNAG